MASPQPSFWSPDSAETLKAIARRAGACVMACRDKARGAAGRKGDGSPVTEADRESQRLIIAGLRELTSAIPIVAEEQDNPGHLIAKGTYWLVDPLDGTRDYVAGGTEFSVNIGLVIQNEPCIGVIYAPVPDDLFYGDPSGSVRVTPQGTTALKAGGASAPPDAPPRLLTSWRESKRLPIAEWAESGRISSWRPCSSGYKFGLLAAGEADFYPRAGHTCEWDTAAGDAILRAAGGRIVTRDGAALAYGKPRFLNDGFIACGPSFSAAALARFIEVLNQPPRPVA